MLSVYLSVGFENSKLQDLFGLKTVLSPQRGSVLHCKHFVLSNVCFAETAFGKG